MSAFRSAGHQDRLSAPGLDLWPHRLLWSGDTKAFVTFGVRVPEDEPGPWRGNGTWKEWREQSRRVEELDRWLPNNEPHLRRDGYASINQFFKFRRSLDSVIRLGATFVDIDCGRSAKDCSAEEAAEMILDLASRGTILCPSMFQFSGRGLWAFWLLRDERNPEASAFADSYSRDFWRVIQNGTADAIVSAFPGLPVDRGAADATRMTRLSGSINPRSGRRVRYELLPGPADEAVRYTLDDLARSCGLSVPARSGQDARPKHRRDLELEEHRRRQDERARAHERRAVAREGVDATLSAYGRQGHLAVWQRRIEFLDRVRTEVYGGIIPCGHRFHMLTAYAYCYAKLTKDTAALEAKIFELGRGYCEDVPGDRVTDSELRDKVEHARGWADSGQQIRNRRLAEFAGLDPVGDRERIERLGLNLQTGLKGRDELALRRREMARKIFESALACGEVPPSARKLERMLVEAGCKTSRGTAHALLRELLGDLQPAAGTSVGRSGSPRPIPHKDPGRGSQAGGAPPPPF